MQRHARKAAAPDGSARVSPRRAGPTQGATHGATDGQTAKLLDLQASAGNAAVTSLVTGSHGHAFLPFVQRYEAGEHSQFGSSEKVMINGVEMTQGDVIAMGDFYDTPEAMKSANPNELAKLRDLIRRDQRAYRGEAGVTPVGNKEWDDATGGRYLTLASQNVAHFAPPAGQTGLVGVNHKAKWYDLSKQALSQAWLDGRTNGQKVSNEARTIDSFAAHFLTDAFAAGHLINKPSVTQLARTKWSQMATSGMLFKETTFTKLAASGIVSHPKAKSELAKYELKLLDWGDVTAERFSEFMYQVASREPDKFFNAFARMVHDSLDDAIKGDGSGAVAGLDVTNDRGDKWKLAGDATLSSSPDTLRIASAAVAQANANLAVAARAQSEPNYSDLQGKVWEYTPKPTTGGQGMIDDVIKRLTNPDNFDAVEAMIKLTVDQLPTAIGELVGLGYMRPKTKLK